MSSKAADRVREVLESGYIGQGEVVERFEAEFGRLVGAPYPPLSVNSGTSALDLALHLIGVEPGDEVISTPMTCTATNTVIVNRRAKIVWADIDPITGLIDPEDVGRKITRRTKAIMAVDWAGRPCDYRALKEYGIPVVEDAAHALLAQIDGASIATAGGDYVCWSFQAIKHLTTGDGGALLPPADQLERGRLLRWYGLDRRSTKSFRCEQNITEAGYKYQMNDINASIGLANLEFAECAVAACRANAAWYHRRLGGVDAEQVSGFRCQVSREDGEEVSGFRGQISGEHGVDAITLPPPDPGSAWWLYTLLVPDRDRFIAFMEDAGIEASPVHARNDRHTGFQQVSGFRDQVSGNDALPGVDRFAAHEVAIPVGWWLRVEERERVAEAVSGWRRRPGAEGVRRVTRVSG